MTHITHAESPLGERLSRYCRRLLGAAVLTGRPCVGRYRSRLVVAFPDSTLREVCWDWERRR